VYVLIVDAVAHADDVKNTVPEPVKVDDAVPEGTDEIVTAADRVTVTVTDTRLVPVILADTLVEAECEAVFVDVTVTETDGDVEKEFATVLEI